MNEDEKSGRWGNLREVVAIVPRNSLGIIDFSEQMTMDTRTCDARNVIVVLVVVIVVSLLGLSTVHKMVNNEMESKSGPHTY